MKRLNLWLGSSILLPLFAASPAQAQRVSADVRIDGGPVAGRLFIGDWREWYRDRPRPVVVLPSRPIYVERIRVPGPDLREEWYKDRKHWMKHRDDWSRHRQDWFRRRNEWITNFRRDARVLAVYYDGLRIYQFGDEEAPDMNAFEGREFEAIEYYAGPSQTPPELNMTGNGCGVLVLWTRQK